MSCEIRFCLHSDAPEEFVAAWKTMVKALTDTYSSETDELHKAISQKVQATATLHTNDTNILNRVEGGFGGENNLCDRQIRFKAHRSIRPAVYDPLEIRMCALNGDFKTLPSDPCNKDPCDHKMEWTMPDLIDFKRAAVIALNEYLYGKASPGYLGSLCLQADVVFYGLDVDDAGTAEEKDAFEFYVHNYPNWEHRHEAAEAIARFLAEHPDKLMQTAGLRELLLQKYNEGASAEELQQCWDSVLEAKEGGAAYEAGAASFEQGKQHRTA